MWNVIITKVMLRRVAAFFLLSLHLTIKRALATLFYVKTIFYLMPKIVNCFLDQHKIEVVQFFIKKKLQILI